VSKPTLNDVARAAGVSRATASRALSDYGRIAPETVTAVKKAAERIGYQPNEIARSMRAGKTKTIGLVIIADFTNVFFDRATKGIVDTARALGYQVLIYNTNEDVELEREAIATLTQKRVDGLIVVPSTSEGHEHLVALTKAGTPLVVIDREVPGVKATTITTDDASSCEAAVDAAVAQGHTKLGFLVATPTVSGFQSKMPVLQNSAIESRVRGFQSGAKKHKGVKATWCFSDESPATTIAAAESLLDSPAAPTIIFTSNNDMALAMLKVVGQRGLTIGKDISLVTVDDSAWLEAVTPGITVIERPVDELAELAVRKLVGLMEKTSTRVDATLLPTRLISRGSIATLN
jgi:LacI family transcriptional regulator